MEIPKIIYEKFPDRIEWALKLKKELTEEIKKIDYFNRKELEHGISLPLLINETEQEKIKKTSEKLSKIVNKTLFLILHGKSLGNYIRINKDTWNAIKRENTDSKTENITFSKLKGSFDKNGLIKYFEFRTTLADFLTGQEILDLYNKNQFLSEIFKENKISFINKTRNNFIRFLGKYCKKINFSKKEKAIAFIFPENSYEYKIYYKVLKKKGYNLQIIKPEDLNFTDAMLRGKDRKIEFVIMAAYPDNKDIKRIKPLIDAYISKKVEMLAPVRDSIASEKTFFALMSNPKNHRFYNPSEISFIKKHIPWSRVVRHEKTTDMDGNEIDLIEYIIKNQEKLILKKSNSSIEGEIGAAYEMNEFDWKTLISWILSSQDYWIVQEKISSGMKEIYVVENNKVNLKKLYWCFKPVLLNNKFQTCYGNTSEKPVVTIENNGIELPVGFIRNT